MASWQKKKKPREGMTAVHTYIGGKHEGKPRTTLNQTKS